MSAQSWAPTVVGWAPPPNGRGTIDILFENFLALFVCVWTVLHHNLQARHEGFWSVFFRKCRWAVLAVTAPEMLTLFPVMQWVAANISVREMQALGVHQWTKLHAFYANAGGFMLQTPGFPRFPINATSVRYLISYKLISPPTISKEDIWDRSKSDHFAKTFAFVQSGWIILQIIARATQHLTITPLELFTAAFIVPSLTTAYFWASKPQNVAEPTVILVDWSIAELLVSAGDVANEPYVNTAMDFVQRSRIPNDYSPPPPTATEATVVWVVSIIHAVIHALGWSFHFGIEIETVVWRVSNLVLLAVMAIGGLVPKQTWIRRKLFNTIVNIAYVVYIIARICIMVEVFLAFQGMPEDVYVSAEWIRFWPHV
ncbi:hypothetical protein QBC35DRAFT_518779 [Podospora australis]|uniref:Uncharacterized protein n=1 Tax=Podospora australis TaxID=1536484 RepID=A0AAN7AE58_9PEZI|nr:hypothetical protein QBC35DRAFT_518779 [Podospora australis]